jgi:UDP-2,3-diacylglucosamine hydrolase
MTTLFISDLHLTATRPAVTELFIRFLRQEARAAAALYILGDFLEYWIGDDALAHPEHRPIIDGLRGLSDSGVPIHLMHGNRDFLLGDEFAHVTGCRLMPDPSVIDLYGKRVLLMHGDVLCTEDVEYQQFRQVVRDPQWQRQFLALPASERDAIARNYREKSRESTSHKPLEIMDVTQAAVEAAMREHRVRELIHGHTHRPAEHRFTLDGAAARRIVLGDWYEQGSVLRCGPDSWKLSALPLPAAR